MERANLWTIFGFIFTFIMIVQSTFGNDVRLAQTAGIMALISFATSNIMWELKEKKGV